MYIYIHNLYLYYSNYNDDIEILKFNCGNRAPYI